MFLDPPVKARSTGWRDCVCLQQDKAWLHHMYSPHILTMRQHLTQACKTVQGVMDVHVYLTGDAVTARPYRELTDKYLVTDFIIENDIS